MTTTVAEIISSIKQIKPAPSAWLHIAIFLKDGGVLADETFRVESFQGSESISEHFEFNLELHANTSGKSGVALTFDDMIGCPITVGISFPALNDANEQPIRDATRDEANEWFSDALNGADEHQRISFFNGIVATFAVEQPGVYRITMRPSLWKLTLTNAYRVLPQMSVSQAIEAMLKPHGIRYSVSALTGSDNLAATRIQDWLQAGESDYEFLKRLMSKAHIHYYYKNTALTHQAVFSNKSAYPLAIPDGRPLRYCYSWQDEDGPIQPDLITNYSFEQSLTSSFVNSVFTTEEAASDEDRVATFHSYHNTPSGKGDLPFNQYMIYKYGGSGTEVAHFASLTQDTINTSSCGFNGSSHCPFLHCGHQFMTTQYPREDQHPSHVTPALQGRSWTLTQIEHKASGSGTYQNNFRAVQADGLVTPFSIQDTQQGAVLAKVVAVSPDAKPPADWRFYEKNVFAMETQALTDLDGTPNTQNAKGVCVVFSSDAERAKPIWVKLSANMETVPEVGSMVLISRSQDQSEIPEIQNVIASHGNKTVTPSGWIPSNTVGSSYSTSYGDGISIHFGRNSKADLATAQGIVTNQYNSRKYRDTSYSQGASYSYSTSESGASGLLSTSESFGSTYSTAKGATSSNISTFDNTYNESLVVESAVNKTTVLGLSDNTTTQTLVQSLSLTGSSSSQEIVGLSTSMNATAVSSSLSATGTRKQVSLEGSSNSLSMNGENTSITLNGINSQVNATGSSTGIDVTGTSTHTSLVGFETSTRLSGSSTNTSIALSNNATNIVASQSEISLTGSASHMSVLGINTNLSVIGSTTDLTVAASATNISIKALSTNIDITAAGLSVQLAALMFQAHITGITVDIPTMKIIT